MNLTAKILIGMAAGYLFGSLMDLLGLDLPVNAFLVDTVLFIVGKVFLASLTLLVVPLVFVSLVCGTAALDDIKKLGRVGGRSFVLYLSTTAIAISLALLAAFLIQPGVGFNLQADMSFQVKEVPSLVQTIINIFPTNPIKAMAEGNMLQIIIFAILFGLALTMVGQKGKPVLNLFESANEVIMKMVMIIMELAPYGVFCLIAQVFAKQGIDAIVPLAKYFFVVSFVLLAHLFITYPILLKFAVGVSPIQFFRNFKNVMLFAFSTASSNATLPVTLQATEKKLGVNNSIASFTVPLGATINMDGTAVMQGVATVFIAQAYGFDLNVSQFLLVVLTAVLASVGTAGVPGVGLVMLAMVLKQVGLPVEGIGLIIGVDRLLDMMRTAVNVAGDATVSCVVAKMEDQFSEEIFLKDD